MAEVLNLIPFRINVFAKLMVSQEHFLKASCVLLSVPEEKPKDGFISGLQDQQCLEGETATLTCEVTKPGAKVKWFKNGKEIKPDGKKYEVVVDDTVHKLIIHDVTPEDQTEYSAKLGDETTTCNLIVDGMYLHN